MDEISDDGVKARIFDKLARGRIWGGHVYKPVQSVTRWIAMKIKRNGKRVRKIMQDLVKDGYLLTYKEGSVISLNIKKQEEIMKIIEKELYKK